MRLKETTLRKNYLYKGKVITLRKDDALLPSGKECVREIIEHSGGSCVLFVKGGNILFVKQYRYAYGEELYELPAGKLNGNEDPRDAAVRELEEETGIRAQNLELLFTVYPTPGYTNEKIYLYYATEGVQTAQNPDEDEFLEVEWIPVKTAREMLQRGEIKDAKTIIALQAYFLR
ncbi:MAG: NUDIX hydrolase [Clostridia bacterium]|nr:NUDIX hydrolase [Clostridia bacterium]